MEPQNAKHNVEFTWKKEKGLIRFNQEGIKIPEHLSSLLQGDISDLIADKLISRDNNFYIFKVGPEIKLKIRKKIRLKKQNESYTITFGVGLGLFSRPILKFKNMGHEQYRQLLQILESSNIFSLEILKEFEDEANDWIDSRNSNRNMMWGVLGLFALMMASTLTDHLTGKYRVVFISYLIFDGIYILHTLIFYWGKSSNPDKLRKIHITQKIGRNLFIFVTAVVYTFAFTI